MRINNLLNILYIYSNMSANVSLENIAKHLTSVSKLTELSPDITWNTFNNTVSAKLMYTFLLAKLYAIPMIDFMETDPATNAPVYTQLGLQESQATTLQGFATQLMAVQQMLQTHCIQSYVNYGVLSEMLQEAIDDLPKETNLDSIQAFMNAVGTFQDSAAQFTNDGQHGGSKRSIFVVLLQVFLLFALSTPTEVELYSTMSASKQSVFDSTASKMLNIHNAAEFNKDVQLFKTMASRPSMGDEVSLSKTVTAVDVERDRIMKSIWERILALRTTVENGDQLIMQMVQQFNTRSNKFSLEVETICIELMQSLFDNKIFASLKSLDDALLTEEKVKSADKEIFNNNMNTLENVGLSVTSGVLGLLTGDPGILLSSVEAFKKTVGNGWSDLISPGSSAQKLVDESNVSLTPNQQYQLTQTILEHSKLICSFGYTIQLDYDVDTNMLKMIGDKISYTDIENYITVLEKNIQIEMDKLSRLGESDANMKYALESVSQRLVVLKTITIKLKQIFQVSNVRLTKMQRTPTIQTVYDVQSYFTQQIDSLESLLSELNMKFPLNYKNEKENIERLQENAEIERMKAYASQLNTAISINMTKSMFKSAHDVLYETVKGTAATVLAPLEGVLTSASASITNVTYDSVNELIQKFTDNVWDLPSMLNYGFIPGMYILLLFAICSQLNNIIYTFNHAGGLFMCIVSNSLIFVYKVVTTPFGYCLRMVGVYANQNASPLLQPRNEPFQIEAAPDNVDELMTDFNNLQIAPRTGGKTKKHPRSKRRYKTKRRVQKKTARRRTIKRRITRR